MPESQIISNGQIASPNGESVEIQSRNIIVVHGSKSTSRNIYKLETAIEFLKSFCSDYSFEDYAVVLCLALGEERVMLDNSEFHVVFDEIEYIKVVRRVDAKNKPPHTFELSSVCKMKS